MTSFEPTEDEKEFVDVAEKLAMEIRDSARLDEHRQGVNKGIVQKIQNLGFTDLETPSYLGGLEFGAYFPSTNSTGIELWGLRDSARNTLPKTATDYYNWLTIGALLFFYGLITISIIRKKALR